MIANRNHLCAGVVLAALIAGSTITAVVAQESGTVLSQTLTLVKNAVNPAIDFDVVGGSQGKSAGTTTKIYLEIGPDGNTALPPPDPNLPNTVKFKLSKSGVANPVEFTPAGGSDAATFAPKLVVLSKGLENPADPRGLYVLAVAHLQSGVPANTTENWKLEILNLPTGLRVVAAVDQGNFKSLAPTGVYGCPAGQICQVKDTCSIPGQSCKGPCPPMACPIGESCQPIISKFPWWKYVKEMIRLPFPQPPCLSCPPEWGVPIPENFARVMVSLAPYDNEQNPLGPGKADQIRLNIKGGEPTGGLVDVGNGEYLQMIQYRAGESPRVSATAAGVTSPEVLAGPEPSAAERTYKILTYVFGALLIAALGAIAWLVRARSGSAGGAIRG